jgi:serine/threonine-protein kinase HipA
MMRKIEVSLHGIVAGHLTQVESNNYIFKYLNIYKGPPISRTLPLRSNEYTFDGFPSFFDGLLPEGSQLSYLLKSMKIDENDYFSQLITIGDDFVGAVSIKEVKP